MYRLHPAFRGVRYYLADNWTSYLTPDPSKPFHYAEIGVFYGANMISVAEIYGTHPDSTLIAIDPWTEYDGYCDYKDQQLSTIYESFQQNMSDCGLSDRVTVKRGYSLDVVPDLPDNHFDAIFIDGNHEPEYVLEDAVLAFRKIKIGGMLIFDDYGWGGPDCTQRGIDAFLSGYHKRIIRVGNLNNQVFVRKTS